MFGCASVSLSLSLMHTRPSVGRAKGQARGAAARGAASRHRRRGVTDSRPRAPTPELSRDFRWLSRLRRDETLRIRMARRSGRRSRASTASLPPPPARCSSASRRGTPAATAAARPGRRPAKPHGRASSDGRVRRSELPQEPRHAEMRTNSWHCWNLSVNKSYIGHICGLVDCGTSRCAQKLVAPNREHALSVRNLRGVWSSRVRMQTSCISAHRPACSKPSKRTLAPETGTAKRVITAKHALKKASFWTSTFMSFCRAHNWGPAMCQDPRANVYHMRV